MNRQEETVACVIEYAPGPPQESFLVSFEAHSDGGSEAATFSTLAEALDFVRDAFPAVWQKWQLHQGASR